MHSLPLFVRLSGRPVILLGDGDAAAAKQRLLERAGALITDDAEAAAALAVVAIDDVVVATDAAQRLRARGLLVNVVDRPALCDFTFTAIVDRDPVLVAIGTGGASAGLAKQLRLRIEALLPPSLGALATQLSEARGAIRARWPAAADRRRAIDSALAAGGPLDPLRSDSALNVEHWAATGAVANLGAVHVIRLLSDDPDMLTLRDARLLGEADVVRHAEDIPKVILARVRADARLELLDNHPVHGDGQVIVELRRTG